jgi:hypothetical protein
VKRVLTALVVALGTLAIVGGLALAVVLTPVTASDAGAGAAVVVLVGVGLTVKKLYSSGRGDETTAPPPWTEAGALVDGTPEETADPADVTGAALATLVDDACERARDGETVEDGFEVVRPPLRRTLADVLVAGGTDPAAAEKRLASGDWTDDPVAAAVVDESVRRPSGTLRERVRAWLFPERVVRRETARTVRAIAETAEETLPPVVGQRAPRTVPTLAPSLGSLQRAADGTLQRASGPATNGSAGTELSNGRAEPAESPTEAVESVATDADSDDDTLVEEVWDDA